MGEPIRPKNALFDAPATVTMTEAEFSARVAEAAQKAATEAAAVAIAKLASQPGVTPGGDAKSLLEGLALAIAEMSHQGDKRDKPIDPKVLAERRAAQERLDVMLADIAKLPQNEWPLWRCRSRVILADHIIESWKRDPSSKKAVPIKFRWRFEPNDAMIPLNEIAERVFAEFRKSRGNKGEYNKYEPRREPWFTDKGLLIEGAAPARREIIQAKDDIDEDVLDVGEGPHDPNAPFVRVLGSSHKPARQYNADQPIF